MDLQRNRQIIVHLAVLVCLCGLIQVVVISRSAVTAIDAVRFVRIARQIDAVGFLQTVRVEGEQPLFPLALSTTHGLLRSIVGETPSLWATSAQATAGVALLLAVVPVYFICRRLVGPTGGFIAGVFFCVLPEVARLGADGISDSTHLLFFSLAFWVVLEFFRTEKIPLMIVAGLVIGLALLTRLESIMLLPAILATAILIQLRVSTRRSWAKLVGAGVAMLFGLLIVFGPYLFAVGLGGPDDSSIANAALRIRGRWYPAPTETSETTAVSVSDWLVRSSDNSTWQTIDGHRLDFSVKEPEKSIRHRGYGAAFGQFVEELADAFGYLVAALSVLGVIHLWRLGRIHARPSEILTAVFSLLFASAIIRFTAAEGYLNARHLLLLVVVGAGPAGIAAMAISHQLRRQTSRLRMELLSNFFPLRAMLRPLPVVVVIVVAICLVTTLRPLHAGRAAHRQAGCWLAAADGRGSVLDTKGWTDLYSTRATFQYNQAKEAFADRRLEYVVVQKDDLASGSDRAHTLRFLLQTAAEPAAGFAGRDGQPDHHASVTVYRWYPDRFRRLVATGHRADSNTAKNLVSKGDS